jgi:hypothetical protein
VVLEHFLKEEHEENDNLFAVLGVVARTAVVATAVTLAITDCYNAVKSELGLEA